MLKAATNVNVARDVAPQLPKPLQPELRDEQLDNMKATTFDKTKVVSRTRL